MSDDEDKHKFSDPNFCLLLQKEDEDDLGHVRALPMDKQAVKRHCEDASEATGGGILTSYNRNSTSGCESSKQHVTLGGIRNEGKEQVDPYAYPGNQPTPRQDLPPLRKQLKTSNSVGEVKLLQTDSDQVSSSSRSRSLPNSESQRATRTSASPDVQAKSGNTQPPTRQETPANSVKKSSSSKQQRRRVPHGSLRVCKNLSGYDPSKPCAFDVLSDEVILNILSYLNRGSLVSMARTCKRLKAISYDETLWNRVDLADKWLGPGVVGAVAMRGTQVLRMAKTHVTQPIFKHSSSHSGGPIDLSLNRRSSIAEPMLLPRLQYLDLSNSSISAESIKELVGACRGLIKLSLEHCQVNDDAMTAVSKNLDLKTLHLGMVQGLTPKGLEILGRGLTSIEELNLGWINLKTDMLQNLRNGLLKSNTETLSRLNLAGAKDSLNDETVEFIALFCPNLVELDVSDAGELTSASVNSLVECANNLVVLSMSRCYKVELRSFLGLVNCISLKEFNAHGMLKDSNLQELRKRLSPIEVNVNVFSHIARPTTGYKRTSIWNMKTRQDTVR